MTSGTISLGNHSGDTTNTGDITSVVANLAGSKITSGAFDGDATLNLDSRSWISTQTFTTDRIPYLAASATVVHLML